MSTVSFVNNAGTTFTTTFYTCHKDFDKNRENYEKMLREPLRRGIVAVRSTHSVENLIATANVAKRIGTFLKEHAKKRGLPKRYYPLQDFADYICHACEEIIKQYNGTNNYYWLDDNDNFDLGQKERYIKYQYDFLHDILIRLNTYNE